MPIGLLGLKPPALPRRQLTGSGAQGNRPLVLQEEKPEKARIMLSCPSPLSCSAPEPTPLATGQVLASRLCG